MSSARAPYRVIFLCTGNICRSPAAENIFRAYARRAGILGALEIDSAGTGDWHEGDPLDPRSADALREAGYAAEGVARGLRASDLTRPHLFVCMDHTHRRALMARGVDPQDIVLIRSFDHSRDDDEVPDPYYGGDEGFRAMITMLEAAMEGLLTRVRADLERAAEVK